MTHVLPELSYSYDALEPYIDKQTMELHHGKHHATYVTKLNEALDKHPELQEKTIEWLLENLSQVPEDIRTAVKNNGGGHYNHSLYWKIMRPNATKASGELLEEINQQFGSIDKLKETLTDVTLKQFGSGWGWISLDKTGKLIVHSTSNQDCPLSEGLIPLIGLDVWEHAYYLKYQNRRPDYIKAWIDNVADGEIIGSLYAEAKAKFAV